MTKWLFKFGCINFVDNNFFLIILNASFLFFFFYIMQYNLLRLVRRNSWKRNCWYFKIPTDRIRNSFQISVMFITYLISIIKRYTRETLIWVNFLSWWRLRIFFVYGRRKFIVTCLRLWFIRFLIRREV